jgi:hypothetical protein
VIKNSELQHPKTLLFIDCIYTIDITIMRRLSTSNFYFLPRSAVLLAFSFITNEVSAQKFGLQASDLIASFGNASIYEQVVGGLKMSPRLLECKPGFRELYYIFK